MARRWADLAGFYFFYFAFLGALIPYASLWLSQLHMNAVQIGLIMGAFIGTKIVAPALWGHLSDVTGQRVRWMRLAAGLTVLFVAGWLWAETFWPLLLAAIVFSFFYHAMLPQGEAVTLQRLSDRHRYGQVRLWGSIGFIAAVMGTGQWLAYGGVAQLPWLLVGAAVLLWLTTLWIREPARSGPVAGESVSLKAILRRPAVRALLATTFLVTASHGVYYNFYSLALTEAGFDKTVISLLWSWAVLVEVGLFLVMHRLFASWPAGRWLQVAMLLTALRWGLNMLWPTVLPVQLFAQALHAASYALFHGAAMMLIDRCFPGRTQVRGQGLYAAVSHGLGGSIGAVLAGWLWHWGGGTLGYGVSIVMTLLAIWLFARYGRSLAQSCDRPSSQP